VRAVVRLFGVFPVFTVDLDGVFLTGDDNEEEEEESRIEGGSAHNFERDVNPIKPEDRYDWEWEDKRGFGFR
jgi:1,4-alpha-glucan branching enzyme